MASTLDVASAGRFELGVGAGWNEWEWREYGYGFPPRGDRLQYLRETLEVLTRMFGPERATFEGSQVRVRNAVLEPKGLQQPRIPIIVGGNGPNVTWRLAVKFADELNLDGPTVDNVEAWLPTIRQRCEEAGRDPATLPVSALLFWRGVKGAARIDALGRLRELGLYRVHTDLGGEAVAGDEAYHEWKADCLAAGVEVG
jgi:alkanesulfonate monooxygenase SsuD/methylene tetrahydromethanopterin reductase-like flavin-dependent oxidoreductase (luciferase family)